MAEQESARAEQNRISKEIGPQIGKLKGRLKKVEGAERDTLQRQITELEGKPKALKSQGLLLGALAILGIF